MSVIYQHKSTHAYAGNQSFLSRILAALKEKAAQLYDAGNQKYALRQQRRTDRQAFAHLLKLDDNILQDIGVTRDDIIWANSLPIAKNASIELQKIARS